MQNKGKVFTFLFSHSSKSKIQIRRIEISKRLLQNGSLGLILIFSLSIFGTAIVGVFNNGVSADQIVSASVINPAVIPLSTNAQSKPLSVNYSRPASSTNYVLNSGGPLVADANNVDDAVIENQLRVLATAGDQASLPLIWAHAGKINNEFGFRRNPFGGRTYEFHAGIDIDGERGDLVVAPASGIVTKASWQGGYGNMVEIDHGNGLISRYGHLSKVEVEEGAPLQRGQLLGFVGSTGRSTGPHLHYELRFNDKPINPRRFLPPEPIQLTRVRG